MLMNIIFWISLIITFLYSLVFILRFGLWILYQFGIVSYEFDPPFPVDCILIEISLIISTYILYCLK